MTSIIALFKTWEHFKMDSRLDEAEFLFNEMALQMNVAIAVNWSISVRRWNSVDCIVQSIWKKVQKQK